MYIWAKLVDGIFVEYYYLLGKSSENNHFLQHFAHILRTNGSVVLKLIWENFKRICLKNKLWWKIFVLFSSIMSKTEREEERESNGNSSVTWCFKYINGECDFVHVNIRVWFVVISCAWSKIYEKFYKMKFLYRH